MSLTNHLLQTTKVIILALLLAYGVSLLHAAWVGPTTAPPLGNTPAPVNVGSTDQSKAGWFGVNKTTSPLTELDITGVASSDKLYVYTGPSWFLGSVGIGTTNPTGAILHTVGSGNQTIRVENTSNNSRLSFIDSGTTAGTVLIGSNGNDFTIFTSSAERMRITSTGNVGIGTINPTYKLVVSNGGGTGLEIDPTGAVIPGGVGIFAFDRSGGTYKDIEIGTPQQLFLDSGGNVGIGTVNPGSNRLEVVGGPIKATGGLIIQTVVSQAEEDTLSLVTGQIWLRTDL